jgi:protein ImuB
MASGQPVHVQADGVRGHVVSSAGPWRTTGDWWTADPWARDEWDVALSDGALYRIYSEQGRWFVAGSYD